MRELQADVLIIGSGGAGLMAAAKAAEKGARVLVVDKGLPSKSGSTVGAAGLAATGPWSPPEDSADMHFRDTVVGGAFLNDQLLVRIMVNEVADRVRDLERWGMPFDRKEDSSYFLDIAAGHSNPRLLARSDRVGVGMAKVLWSTALRMGVEGRGDVVVTRLLKRNGRVAGAVGLDLESGELLTMGAGAVILATGGIGQLYPLTSNSVYTTGNGLAMAAEAGAVLVNMEQVQFYPECLVHPESIRGFGLGIAEHSRLFNGREERFLAKLDPVGLEKGKTRDIMSRAIYGEIREGRGSEHDGVYLDATQVPREVFRNFRHEYELCLENGIDLMKERAEVAPGAHYFMGGIRIDEKCKSSVPGLYAAGEVTGGVMGGNRLSGNSLADILVFGARAGVYAAEEALERGNEAHSDPDPESVGEEEERMRAFLERRRTGPRPSEIKDRLRGLMWERVSVIRSEASLEAALGELADLEEQLPRSAGMGGGWVHNRELMEYLEADHMLLVAEMITRSALMRKESRGAHFLEEHPERRDDEWLVNTAMRLGPEKFRLSAEPVRFTEMMVED